MDLNQNGLNKRQLYSTEKLKLSIKKVRRQKERLHIIMIYGAYGRLNF